MWVTPEPGAEGAYWRMIDERIAKKTSNCAISWSRSSESSRKGLKAVYAHEVR